MNKLFNIILMATALTFWWGCGSSDDDTPSPVPAPAPVPDPQWKVEFKLPQGEAGNPQWADKQVDFYQFENTMSIVLRLEDEMTPFLSDNDQMAAIVNGEVREVSSIQHYDYGGGEKFSQFMLLVPFADQDKSVDLYYYNAKTTQSWLLTSVDLRADNTLGSETEFVVGLFTAGTITAKLDDSANFTYNSGDRLALFAGDVCCGVGTYDSAQQQWSIKTYRRLAPTEVKAHFRYYSAQRQAIYKTVEMIDFSTIHRSVLTPYYMEFE